ncbi:MAG: LysM peptidoglycan-binding domain-containing protein [Bacteroidales bacterium]|nr:LysM peptidoglycan-binding domain-containing protein [Bacteroidales bacterium]
MRRTLIALVFCLIPAISLFAQEQKVKKSDIVETLRGVPYYIHFVNTGETIQAIAEAYDVTPEEITMANPEIAGGLKKNQVLKIQVKTAAENPTKIIEPLPEKEKQNQASTPIREGKVHSVEPKETWYGISRLYQVPVKDLISANPGIDTLKIGMQISIPEVIVEKQPQVSAGFLQHTVLAKETLFSLSKRYNVTIDELYRHNPVLTEGLKTGQILNIPDRSGTNSGTVDVQVKPKQQEPQEKKTEAGKEVKYTEHIVLKKETLYSISKKYDVEVDDILKANPGLSGELEKNQVLRIPVPVPVPAVEQAQPVPVTPEEPLKVPDHNVAGPCSPLSGRNQQYNVALLIPFMLEEADSISLGDPASLRLPSDYRSLSFIQFYEGALIAIDSLSKAGMNVKVHVFDADAGEHVTKTRRILANPEMAAVDLIIGPFFAKSFEMVAEFAASHSIPVVNPLSQRSEILNENPYVFKAQPSAWSQYNETARYIANNFSNANILIIRRNADENSGMAATIKSSVTKFSSGNASIKEAIYSQSFDAGLLNNLVAGKKNVVIMLTSDKALLPALLRKLNDARAKYDITLFGLPDWEDLELDSHYLLNLDTHLYNAWFVDYSRQNVQDFVRNFNERFKAEPEQIAHAFLGYDVSLYFLNSLFNYGRGFSNCLDSAGYKGLSTGFSFWKTEGGGYENTASSVYELKDYKRKLVNR